VLIKIPKKSDVNPSEITPEEIYLRRRDIIKALTAGVGMAGVGLSAGALADLALISKKAERADSVDFADGEKITPFDDVTSYNNFYEFGTEKSDPAEYAHEMSVDPWSVTVEGHAKNTGTFTLEDLVRPYELEERIYRLRCVEAWSMVVPWVGFPLNRLIERFEPTSKAKYVFFETLYDPEQMRGQRSYFSSIDWPYVEGLRMDEAMNPLTLVAVGMYGKAMPNQNGAPIRLVVPWKHGFKSIKSIVKIRFLGERLQTSWEKTAPSEYGFYSNVNPNVDHPRWSQKTERRLPNSLFSSNRIPTRMFNGYEEEVAHLYKGMDLKKYF